MHIEVVTIGDELLLGYTLDSNAAHLARDAGQHRDPPATLVLEPDPGRRTVIVAQLARASGQHGLLAVRGGHLALEDPLEPLLHPGEVLLVEHHAATEQRSDRRLGQIVARRSEAAGRDHPAGAVETITHGARDRGGRVTHRRPPRDLHPFGRERARQVRGVGVDRVAEQQLVADRDDFDVHETE